MCNFDEMSVEERRGFVRRARGKWRTKVLYCYGETHIEAQGFEYDDDPMEYVLVYDGNNVYRNRFLKNLFDTDEYTARVINEEEIDVLRQAVDFDYNPMISRQPW